MDKINMGLRKRNLKSEINNLIFNKKLDFYLIGGYTVVTTCGVREWIANHFEFSEIYIPVALGCIGIMSAALKDFKRNNYKLKKASSELSMIEFGENFLENLELSEYLLKK